MKQGFDWGFWFLWMMSTTLGWVLGRFLVPNLALVTTGLAIGILQWFALQRLFKAAWRWIIASTLGWTLGAALILFLVPAPAPGSSSLGLDFLSGLVTGLSLGGAQWLILREQVRLAGWWIPINIVAWTTGFAFLPGLLMTGVAAGLITATALALLMSAGNKAGEKEKR